MGLREYNRKRNFGRTPEPKGGRSAKEGRSFVVQKHRARQLHYDFRLELDGVLKSWAVPKGPCLDPHVKRLAMQVEDHPVEYGAFEGIIPPGEYGGGTVMLWDRGQWEPVGDPAEGYKNGRLKFKLHGDKLRGGWILIRTHGWARSRQDERQWLLLKESDARSKPIAEGDILEQKPRSVSTGRSLDKIAADSDRVWNSNGKSERESGARAAPSRRLSRRKIVPSNYDARNEEFAGIRLTHPDKVLYPGQGITKLDLAKYYQSIASWILPHLEDRPIVLVRCPEGRGKACFYQKHPAAGTPDILRQIPVREKNKTEPYVIVDNVAGLISLAQIGALEIHAWGSRADKLERPDRLVFDLDPGPHFSWSLVVQSARQVRTFLRELGLESFVKMTGGKGLHLVVPIDRRHDWEKAKMFCKQVADLIVKADPHHYTANMAKAARQGKIFIDYLRNGRGATAIVPYSPRARAGAPVSVPLTWEELNEDIESDHFHVGNLPRRLSSLKHDPWKRIATTRQSLAGAMRKLRTLVGRQD